jgi:CubicO group peptidase (beta-lactamase class C family)
MKCTLLVFGLVLMSASCQDEEPPTPDLKSRIDEIVKPSLVYGTHAGIVVGILQKGSAGRFAYGYAHVGEGRKVDANSLFEIGSITKTFTAILIKQLETEGLLSLEDPVENFLPQDVEVPTFQGNQITIRHLLTHTAALPREVRNEDISKKPGDYYDFKNEEFDYFLNYYHSLAYAPGTKYSYSNAGFGLLGYVIERLSGKSYYDYLMEKIARPLQISQVYTSIGSVPKSLYSNLALSYDTNQEAMPFSYFGEHQASGSIITTLDDMLRFLKANIEHDHPLYPVFRACHNLLFENPDYDFNGGKPHMAAGFQLFYHNEDLAIGHTGLTNQTAYIYFVPEKQVGVVVLTNSRNPQRTREIGIDILNLLLAE